MADASVDVVMSNCVINLSTDKRSVFREAFRVLAPGGRLAIADIVAITDLPRSLRDDLEAYAGCVSGAALASDVVAMLNRAGFQDVDVDVRSDRRDLIASALIRAKKPFANYNRG